MTLVIPLDQVGDITMRGQQPVMRVNKTRETVEIPHRGDKFDVIVKERRSMRDLKDSTPRNGLK